MPVEERHTQKVKSLRPTKTAKSVRKVEKSRGTLYFRRVTLNVFFFYEDVEVRLEVRVGR